MFQFLLKLHFPSAVVLPVASLLPPSHSPTQWKRNFSSFPSLFFLLNVCIHATHSSAFPSAHPGQISLLSLKMYLGQQKKSKNTCAAPPLGRIFSAFYLCRAVSAGIVTVQTLPPHIFEISITFICSLSLSPTKQLLAFSPELFRIQTQPANFKAE